MLFNSLEFLVFFPMVIALYFAIPARYRWFMLLLASYYFYMSWRVEYIILIVISTVVDFYCGKKMAQLPEKSARKKYLYLSLVSNLGLLFLFKYFNFFSRSASRVFGYLNDSFLHWNVLHDTYTLKLLLPVGISFYTFQTLSYTIDVYNGKTNAESHLGKFALFVSFFPQLVAGPIERSSHLLPQFHKDYDFDYNRVKEGLLLMVWGFFKKLVIADRLAEYVNEVYNNVDRYDGFHNIVATYFFAFQIYCDFSGYSDIAIGSALIMGFSLMQNFRRPYFATNIREFWSRWHISLSTWFRDYLYIPLGGNRVIKWRWYYNLFVTFVVSGLWHGANWTFIVWGFLHGSYLVLGYMTKNVRSKLLKSVKLDPNSHLTRLLDVLVTFHLVLLAWIFFRANGISDTYVFLKNTLSLDVADLDRINLFRIRSDWTISIVAIMLLIIIDFITERAKIRYYFNKMPGLLRWVVLVFTIGLIVFLGKFEEQDFLYFRF
ncbi:MAG: MBOAT family protein [Cytophagales bacterium]|nr:MBOAT family protein [Cytophagales bacterium]